MAPGTRPRSNEGQNGDDQQGQEPRCPERRKNSRWASATKDLVPNIGEIRWSGCVAQFPTTATDYERTCTRNLNLRFWRGFDWRFDRCAGAANFVQQPINCRNCRWIHVDPRSTLLGCVKCNGRHQCGYN